MGTHKHAEPSALPERLNQLTKNTNQTMTINLNIKLSVHHDTTDERKQLFVRLSEHKLPQY